MASFTSSVSDLEAVGPCAEVRLGVTRAAGLALTRVGKRVPEPISIAALVDTGAAISVIQTGLADQLGLQPIRLTPVCTATHDSVSCRTYAIQWLLPNNIIVEGTAIEAPLKDHSMQGLLGRDVLSSAVLVYIGHENQFTLSF